MSREDTLRLLRTLAADRSLLPEAPQISSGELEQFAAGLGFEVTVDELQGTAARLKLRLSSARTQNAMDASSAAAASPSNQLDRAAQITLNLCDIADALIGKVG